MCPLPATGGDGGPDASADVRLRYSADSVELEIASAGRLSSPGTRTGLGIVGMRERAAASGGTIEVGPRPRGGFLVRLRVPRDGARWWVLDYKSAFANVLTPERRPELIAQMQRYCEAVQAQVLGEPVAAAFLSGDGRLVPLSPTPEPGLRG